MSNTITVLGAGYVGLTTAALLAHAGYKVYALEPNLKRLETIKKGKSFFYEAGLDPVITAALESGNFIPTDSYNDSVPTSDIVFSCVGTPDNPDGSSNLTYVFQAAEQAASLMKPGSIFVQKSTVPVGTGARIETTFAANNQSLMYVSNPEFLREGTALQDTLYFDRVVAGGNDTTSVMTVLDVYRQLANHRDQIAKLASLQLTANDGEYISTSLASAELIKVTSNAFLALKISFANSIAKLADKAGADIVEVMNATGSDNRIGRAFLSAGRGYGGGCFPKDVSGLIASGLDYGVDLEIMHAAQSVNTSMPGYIIDKLVDTLDESLTGKKVSVLGLSFKANTSDARRSPGIALANLLQEFGANVSVFDPKANEEASEDLNSNVNLTDSLEAAVSKAEIIIVATEWVELIKKTAIDYRSVSQASTIVDAVNQLDRPSFEAAGFTYIGVGR